MDSRKRLILAISIVVGVVLIFLAGYVPGFLRARRAAEEGREIGARLEQAQAELAAARLDVEIARLRGRLGEVLLDVDAKNFGVAAEKATALFDGLRQAVNSSQLQQGSERRAVLEAILARRDEISADLARAEPGVKAKLAEMYMQFARAIA